MSFILSTIERTPVRVDQEERANASAGPHEWREAMTPAAQAAIDDVFASDFDVLGYKRMETRAAA